MEVPLNHSVELTAPVDRVWALISDPIRSAECLPGAAIERAVDARTYEGTLRLTVGPVPARYRGTAVLTRVDAQAAVVELDAQGRLTEGSGDAVLHLTTALAPTSTDGTSLTVSGTLKITGIFTHFGRGVVCAISDRLFGRFAESMREAMEASIDAGPEGPAAAS